MTLLAAIVLLAAAAVAALQQIRVTDQPTGATRACGSGFDVSVDRSGWEQWWLADLDEPDEEVRATLLRTQSCPAGVNQRLAIAAVLAVGGVTSAVLPLVQRQRLRDHGAPRSVLAQRLVTLGRLTTIIGAGLVAGGLVAIVVLVGDADASIFRYVDRSVVLVGGLLLLAPALTLTAFGLAMSFGGDHRDQEDPDD